MTWTNNLSDVSPYVYGTTRLGHQDTPRTQRVNMASTAMDADVWFHTSQQYDDALEVLSEAFDRDRSKTPRLIVKIGSDSVGGVRREVEANARPLGVEHIDIGQLSFHGELAEQMRTGDAIPELRRLRSEGLVGRFIWEVFPWTSELPIEVLRAGHAAELVDGFIFYLNPLQRFVSNELWDLLEEQKAPMIAMRTVAGGPVKRLRDEPGFAWKDYLRERAGEVAPVYDRSGVDDWSEFCVRFAHSFSRVIATVGSTSRVDHFDRLVAAATGSIAPLSEELIAEICALHRRWSDELDVLAEPWSM